MGWIVLMVVVVVVVAVAGFITKLLIAIEVMCHIHSSVGVFGFS